MKKQLSVIVSIACLLGVVTGFSSAAVAPKENSYEQDLAAAYQCLEVYGELLDGFALSSTALLKSSERKIAMDDIDYPDDYAGAYFNADGDRKLNIYLTDFENLDYYKDILGDKIVNYYDVDYSFNDLYNLYDFSDNDMIKWGINSVSIDDKNNEVDITMKDDKYISPFVDYLKLNNYDPEIANFEVSDEQISTLSETIIENANTGISSTDITTSATKSARSGELVKGVSDQWFLHPDGYYYKKVSLGTITCNAYDPTTGKYGVILSGHQVTPSIPTTFRNTEDELINSNPAEWKSSVVEKGDCAFIPFDSSMNYVPSIFLTNATSGSLSFINRTQFITSPGLNGSPIVQYGNTTGKQTGTITNLFYSYPTTNGLVHTDFIQTDITAISGDSGGPMGIDTPDGLYLMGNITAGGPSISTITKYNNIESILGVEILTLN